MASVINWLNSNSGVIQASAAAIVAIATVAAVWISRRALHALQLQTRQAALPVLALDVNSAPFKNGEDPRDGFLLMVANAGLGPALNVTIAIDPSRDGMQEYWLWPGTALLASERVAAMDARLDGASLHLDTIFEGLQHVEIAQIKVTYEDAYGRQGEIRGRAVFVSEVPPGNHHVRFEPIFSRVPGAPEGRSA